MDLFKALLGKRHHHSSKHHRHHDDWYQYDRHHDYRFPAGRSHGNDQWHENRYGSPLPHVSPSLQQFLGNKTVIGLLILAGLILVVIAVIAMIFLLPIILKMLGFVGENGIKGVLDQAMPIINKLWLGSGK